MVAVVDRHDCRVLCTYVWAGEMGGGGGDAGMVVKQ